MKTDRSAPNFAQPLCSRYLLIMGLLLLAGPLLAQDDFEREPITYSQSAPENIVSQLKDQLEAGSAQLAYDPQFGYLPALLEKLQIPVDSQMLVYSKTSLQLRRISPSTPRAIYFNDDVYVGYCQSGDVLEISVSDDNLGTVFYTVNQREDVIPEIRRQTDNCLVCHSSSRTQGVPGHLARSVFVDASGQPLLSEGSYTVDQTTPLEQRWGGWYVTGTHGRQTHLGNLVFSEQPVPRPVVNETGLNRLHLQDFIETNRYLSSHSDLVALLVMEHQILVQNLLTKANFTSRQAMHYQASLNAALGEAPDHQFESTTRRIQSAAEDLLEAMLFANEVRWQEPLRGTSRFAEDFANSGPHDQQHRSLRELDLNQRLLKYPCSYLIYSSAFRKLPTEIKTVFWQQLQAVLTGKNEDKKYAHLTPADRNAIYEILCQTVPDLPATWTSTVTQK